MKQQESMFCPVVAMVLAGALVIVSVLAWSEPWSGWEAVAALGGWAAAIGTIAAVLVALRVATRETQWREAERERRSLEERFYLISVSITGTLMPSRFRQLKNALSSWEEGNPTSFVSARDAMSFLISSLQELDLNRIAWVSQPAATKIAATLHQLGLARLILDSWDRIPGGHAFIKALLEGNIQTAEGYFNQANSLMGTVVNAEIGLS